MSQSRLRGAVTDNPASPALSGARSGGGHSAQRFRDIVAKAGADVLISNHTNYDSSKTKLPAMTRRKPGDPNPYVIGNESIKRYLTVATECAEAGLLRLK